jgi:hypothetical protein
MARFVPRRLARRRYGARSEVCCVWAAACTQGVRKQRWPWRVLPDVRWPARSECRARRRPTTPDGPPSARASWPCRSRLRAVRPCGARPLGASPGGPRPLQQGHRSLGSGRHSGYSCHPGGQADRPTRSAHRGEAVCPGPPTLAPAGLVCCAAAPAPPRRGREAPCGQHARPSGSPAPSPPCAPTPPTPACWWHLPRVSAPDATASPAPGYRGGDRAAGPAGPAGPLGG